MIGNIICLNLGKKDGKPVLQIIKDVDNYPVQKLIFLTDGFGIYKSNMIMKSLSTELEVKFENFRQYYELIKEINTILSKRIYERI